MTRRRRDALGKVKNIGEKPVVCVWREPSDAVLGFKMHRTTPHIGFLIASELFLGELDGYFDLTDDDALHNGIELSDGTNIPSSWECALVTFEKSAPILTYPCDLPSFALLIESGIYLRQAGGFEMGMEFGQRVQTAAMQQAQNDAILQQIGLKKPPIVLAK